RRRGEEDARGSGGRAAPPAPPRRRGGGGETRCRKRRGRQSDLPSASAAGRRRGWKVEHHAGEGRREDDRSRDRRVRAPPRLADADLRSRRGELEARECAAELTDDVQHRARPEYHKSLI